MTLDEGAKAALVDRLRAQPSDGLRSEHVREAAITAGVNERTVWRWLRSGTPARRPGRPPYSLSSADRDDYAARRGNVAALWRARRSSRTPSLRTLQRAFVRQLAPGERDGTIAGAEGRRRRAVYLRWEPEYRNEVWEADHKELDVLVLMPRAQRPRKPWVTLFLDGYSRLVVGWAIAPYPSADTVLAALRMGLVVDPERGPFGGIPSRLRWDNGLEFAAGALTSAAAVLGCAVSPTPAYTPHLKGKIERFHRTVTLEFLSALPFYTGGPRSVSGRLYGPGLPPMALESLVSEFDGWVRDYNTRLPHKGLGGVTPLEKWCMDATPVRQESEERLRWLLLPAETRKVAKDGIHFHGLIFVAPELNGRVGEEIQVRHMPHDDRTIEIFVQGEWLATARPQGVLSEEERELVLERRRADAREAARRQRRASRRARARLAPMTRPGPVEEVSVISRQQAARDTARRSDRELRRLGRTDLLDLGLDDRPETRGEGTL